VRLDVIRRWFDAGAAPGDGHDATAIDWLRVVPYIGLHLACLGIVAVGWSPVAIAVAVALYAVRMLAITGFYHRYFSHRSFSTSRTLQFVFAVVGASAVQRGPIWWTAHHRQHHLHSDIEGDPHSPARGGFWRSHTGWFLTREHFGVREERVRDWLRYPELRLLDRYDVLVPALLACGLYGLGAWLERVAPALGTSGPQLLVWGFCVSTVVLYHATFTINSLAHRWGSRRYATADDSRNNAILALVTLGEGWHNNHHHYPASVRQGFFCWELDLTYGFIKMLAALGLVWDLKTVPAARRNAFERAGQQR
jgi:stearoyl-CoA desaturase (delta-9 desaturase)